MITPQLNLFSIFIFLGAIQGLFLAFLFMHKKQGNRLSNVLFGSILLCLVVILIDIFSGYSGYIIHYIYLNNVIEPLVFCVGPLFYLYALVETQKLKKLPAKFWLHFFPAIFWAFYNIMYILQPEALKYNDFLNAFHPEIHTVWVEPIFDPDPLGFLSKTNEIIIISISLYLFFTIRLINRILKEKGGHYFSINIISYKWLRVFIGSFVFALAILLYIKIFMGADLGDHIVATYASLMIYSISFYVVRQSSFLAAHEPVEKGKYEKSSLSQEIKEYILQRFDRLMQNEKPYLDNGFSLPILAKQLNISTHNLSQILNEDIRKSFFEYVGELRIEEAKSLLKESGQQLVIEEIAERVGYNSKSAFNNAFKKYTGMTPSQFRENL